MQVSPVATPGEAITIRTDAILTGTLVATSVQKIEKARYVTLWINMDAAATTDTPQIIPLFAPIQGTTPATTDDVWYSPNESDGSNAAQLPGGTGLSGADYTLTPEFAMVKMRPLLLRWESIDATTDEFRIKMTFRCEDAGFFQCHCADVGSGTLANLELKMSVTV